MEGQAQLPVVHFDLEPTNGKQQTSTLEVHSRHRTVKSLTIMSYLALFIDRDQNEHSIMPTLKVRFPLQKGSHLGDRY